MINVTKSYLPDVNTYKNYIDNIYDNVWLTNNGPLVQELEKKLAAFLNVKYLVLVSNATLALQIVIHLLNWRNKKVITSPFSFIATTSSLVWEGVEPIFVDIDPETFNICPEQVVLALKKHPDIVGMLPVHVYGMPCDVTRLQEIAGRHSLSILYDAAHAFGVTAENKALVNYGDFSVLSFHATKLFHTVEGGAIICQSLEHYEKVKQLMNFGFSQGDIVDCGINAKMSEFHAAMGLAVLEDIPYILRKRKEAYCLYKVLLNSSLRTLELKPGVEWNYGYFPVVFESEACLLKIMRGLNKQDIYPRRYFYPSLNCAPFVKYTNMKISEDLSTRVLCLPLYPDLSDADIDRIASIINAELLL